MLTTTHALNTDINKAANEVLLNVKRLIVAGKFHDAFKVLNLFIEPGAWQLSKHGLVVQTVERLLPQICFLCETASPVFGKIQAKSKEQIYEFVSNEALRTMNFLQMPVRFQSKPAGQKWSKAYLSDIVEATIVEFFGEFSIDAEFILKDRLSKIFSNTSTATSQGICKNADEVSEPDASWILKTVFGQVAQIRITEQAKKISNTDIANAILPFISSHAKGLNYQTSFLLQALILLCIEEEDFHTAIQAANILAQSDTEIDYLISIATINKVKNFFASGVCANRLGIDDISIAEYFNALSQRKSTTVQVISINSKVKFDSLPSLKKILSGTVLEGKEIVSLNVPDTSENVYALETSIEEMEHHWKTARSLVSKTGRWPVITTTWRQQSSNFKETLLEQDFFSRAPYENSPNTDDVSPAAILDRAKSVDVEAFVQQLIIDSETQHATYSSLEETLKDELEKTLHRCGSIPTPAEMEEMHINGLPVVSHFQLDRWLLDWEQRNGGSGNPEDARFPWYEPESVYLMFMPTPNSWDALAYMEWFDISLKGAEKYVALGKQWQEQFGAEIFAHFGTIIECIVERPPNNVEDAWPLALQHDLVGTSTLAPAGIELRQYAAGLVNHDQWFLHRRP